jgi:hypothetical protein
MAKYPEAFLPSLDMPDYEKVLLKNFPQFSLYRNLGEFVEKYKLIPSEMITGKFKDFEYLTNQDWEVAKWSFYLYLKVRMDLEDECTHEAIKEGFF